MERSLPDCEQYRRNYKGDKLMDSDCKPTRSAEKLRVESFLDRQIGGGHYKDLKIQPVEYIHANSIPFIEGSIIKYATRWRHKGGIKDLQKIIHFTQLLIELESKR